MRFLLSAGLGASVAAAAFPDLLNLPKPSGAQPLYPAQNSAPKRLSGLSTPPWPVFAASSSGSRACAQVAALNATAQLTVPARLAYDCLQSVPLHTDDALEFVESVRPYVEWQTTLAYLKHPPPGYLEPAVDVKAYLDNITTNLHNGVYKSEYDFEFDLYHAFQLTHDGHFRIFPNILSIFTFRRPISLVSVSPSPNSEQLPKPYVYADIVHHLAAGNSSVQPSAVSKIDGQDALTYLENWSQVGSLQDPDALYNNNFFSLAALAIGSAGTGGGSFAGYGRGGYNYPGPTTTLTFENGTTTTFANFAVLTQNFTGIKSGEDVYYKFVNLPEYVPAPNEPTSMTPVPAPGYPPPVVKEYNNYIGGYFVDEPGYEDIAVLSMPSFVGDGPAPGSFQAVGLDFLYKSKQAGKTKLIIDVSINGGGTVHEGYNLFAELFPHLVPYGATRFRAHEAYNIMGNFISNVSGPVYPPDDTGRYEIDNFLGTPFDYRADVNESYAPFTSWQEKFGPRQFEGDEFTPILRWNLSDFYGIGLNVSDSPLPSLHPQLTPPTPGLRLREPQPRGQRDLLLRLGHGHRLRKPPPPPPFSPCLPLLTGPGRLLRLHLHHLLRVHAPARPRPRHRPRRPLPPRHHPGRRRRQRYQRLPLDQHLHPRQQYLRPRLPRRGRRPLQHPPRQLLHPPLPPLLPLQQRHQRSRRPPQRRRLPDPAAVPLRARRLPHLLHPRDDRPGHRHLDRRRRRRLGRPPLRRRLPHSARLPPPRAAAPQARAVRARRRGRHPRRAGESAAGPRLWRERVHAAHLSAAGGMRGPEPDGTPEPGPAKVRRGVAG